MANTQVPSELIATNAISGTIIADNAITSVHIAQNQVTAVQIPDGSITATQIAADAVGATELAASSVVTASIQDDQVTGDKLANNITIAGTLGVTGETTLSDSLNMGDDVRLKIGAAPDLELWHDASNSIIKNSTGSLYLRSDGNIYLQDAGGNESFATFTDNGAVTLYHDNSAKLATASDGVDITGPNLDITADDARILIEEADGTNITWIGDHTGAGAGGLFLYNHGGTATVKLTADSHANYINNGNSFGIGTASPGFHVDIQKSLSETYSASARPTALARVMNTNTANGNHATLEFGTEPTSGNGGVAYIGSTVTGSNLADLFFGTRTGASTFAERMRIDSSGNQKLTGGTDLYVDLFADSGTGQGSSSFRFYTDGTSAEQLVASIVMQQESGGGSARKGEMLFQVADNGAPATALKIFNNKDVQVDGRIASYYDGNNHVAIRGLNGGQYIQYSSSSALQFMRIDTYPNSGANHTMSLSGSKVRIGTSSPSISAILSVEGGNAGVPALYVSNTNADSLGIRSKVNNNTSNNAIYEAINTDGTQWKIRNDGDHQGTDTSIGSISDSRLKKDVTDLTYDINKFKQYRPVEFNWINPELHKTVSGKSRGFLAQEIGTIDTYYVDKYEAQGDDIPLVDEDGTAHSTKFGYKDAMYISVIKQLITRLETAEAKIAVLEG